MDNTIIVRLATAADFNYAATITDEMEQSAKARGTGIAKRSPDYIVAKMIEGKAIIAVTTQGEWVGFCYIEAWEHDRYVANSGLIVSPAFRKSGVARQIKHKVFELSRQKYPDAKIFGLTTGLAVMKINSELGYEPVTYSELTSDEEFWKGCRSCVNYDILVAKQRKNCICTAMLFDPATAKTSEATVQASTTAVSADGKLVPHRRRKLADNLALFNRWVRLKQFIMLRPGKRDEGNESQKKSLLSLFFFW